jgi:hypothetical protein
MDENPDLPPEQLQFAIGRELKDKTAMDNPETMTPVRATSKTPTKKARTKISSRPKHLNSLFP